MQFLVTEGRSRIRSWIRVRIRLSEARIRVCTKCHVSQTLKETK
jgi:hypothetical protein